MKIALRILAAALLVAPAGLRAETIDEPYSTDVDGPISSGIYTVENDGDMQLGELNANSEDGVTNGDFTFNGLAPLNASFFHAVTGGTFTFDDISTLSASVADAVTGGDFTFNSNSALYASQTYSISGGTLRLYDNATISTTAEDGVIGVIIELHGSSIINIDARHGLCGGSTLSFDDSLGGTGGTLTLNGNDVPIGEISSISGGLIRNQSAQDATLTLDFSTVSTFNGVLEDGTGGGTLAIEKYGAGTLVLGGSNTYTGGTLLQQGTLRLGNSGSSLSDTGALVIDGGTFFMGQANETVGSLSGFGGELRLYDDFGAGRVLTVNQTVEGIYYGDIQGDDGVLVKSGAAALLLYGNNTYTGGTTISAGTLLANSTLGWSATGTGAVTVDPLGTLGGGGYLTGSVVVKGTVSPGFLEHSIGTLSTGPQTWDGNTTYQWEISDADGSAGFGYDSLAVDGAFDIDITSGVIRILLNTADYLGRPGRTENFDSTADYEWFIVSASSVTGFDPLDFDLETAGFLNGYDGDFTIEEDGGILSLVYTGAAGTLIDYAYTTLINGSFGHGVYDVIPPGAVSVDTAGGITAGDFHFAIATPLDVTAAGGVTGGYVEFLDDSTATAGIAGAIDGAVMVFRGDSILSVTAPHALGAADGLSSSTRLTFDGSFGAPKFELNGNNTTVASIESIAPGGQIVNDSASPAMLTIKSSVYDSDLTGMLISDGAGIGALTLAKNGSSTLVLGSANTHTGGTSLKAGTIVFGSADAFGSGPITITGGALTNAIVSLDPVATIPNALVLGGDFAITNPIPSAPALDFDGPVTLTANVTLTNYDDISFNQDISGAFGLTLRGLGIVEFDGNNTFTSLHAYSNMVVASNTGLGVGPVTFETAGPEDSGGSIIVVTTIALSNNMVLNAPIPLILEDGDLTLSGTISGIGGLAILNVGPAAGIVTLTGNNTYQFGTQVFEGALAIGSNTALGTGTLVTGGATVATSGGPRTIANALQISNFFTTFSGPDTLTIQGDVTLEFTGLIPNGIFVEAPVVFSGVVKDAGNLNVYGTSTLELTNTNTYTGETTVNAGTLIVTGSIASSPLTSVQGSGTLAGSGAVGNLLVTTGGMLSPGGAGAPIDTLSSADQTWGEDGIFAFDINNATGAAGINYDSLDITGELAITATDTNPFVFQINTLNGTTPGNMANYTFGSQYQWLVATTTGGITGLTLDNVVFNSVGFSNLNLPDFSLAVIGNNLYLVAVPEPTTYAAGIAALLGLVIATRRLRQAS